MGILSWLVIGLLAGWLASVAVGGSFGIVGDIIVGIVGALLGGWIAATFLGMPDAVNGINLGSIVVAFLGAVVLLGLLRLIRRG